MYSMYNPTSLFNASASSLAICSLLAVIFWYYASFTYCFVRNSFTSRTTGLPSIFIPWDQNSLPWIITSVPLRPILKRHAPQWLSNRLSVMTYNWEYLDRLRPFRELEAKGQPSHTFQFITCGRFEVWTRDREVASEILRRPDDFLVYEFVKVFMNKFGENVFTTDNPSWKRQRKVVATVLNEKISASVFHESLKQTDGMLYELFGTTEKPGESIVTARVFDMMKKITIHVLSGAGMGVSPPWDNSEEEKPKEGFKMTYIQAMKVIIDCMAGPMVLPRSVVKRWPSFFPGAALFHKLGIAMEDFAQHTNNMIEDKKEETKVDRSRRPDILTQLVAASAEAAEEDGKSNTKYGALSQEEMSGNLFIFTVAGFDTTANTLTYALAYVARYPQWQDWLAEEVDAIIPLGAELATWDYVETFPRAKRTLAFMFETLRLNPPVVHEIKTVRSPQTISVSHGTYYIPANTGIYINNVALHLDPEVWRDLNQPKEGSDAPEAEPSAWAPEDGPGDEARFRPTRWLDPETNAFFQPPSGAFLPWNMGPRVCPGQKMAQVEFVTIFLRILASCRIEAQELDVEADGKIRKETRDEINARLDDRVRNSTALLALQMDGIYNIDESKGEGLKLKLTKRTRAY